MKVPDRMLVSAKYIELEAIRGLAALVVVWCHVFLVGLLPSSSLAALPGQFATEGVIAFFVLSGSVITMAKPIRGTATEAFRVYARARVLRLYPCYIVALVATLCTARAYGDTISPAQYLKHLVFLQSLTGYPVAVLPRNQALWSLANEAMYYAIFSLTFFSERIIVLWTIGAVAAAVVTVSSVALSPAAKYVAFMLALSLPWLIGHWTVVHRERIPRIHIGVGLACVADGIIFSRCYFNDEYYDPIRLSLFALGVATLIASILQGKSERPITSEQWLFRIGCLAVASTVLWTTSHSMNATKVLVTGLGVVGTFGLVQPVVKRAAWISQCLMGMAALGSISYPIYAMHSPIIFLVTRLGSGWDVSVRVLLFAVATLVTAALLERGTGWLRDKVLSSASV